MRMFASSFARLWASDSSCPGRSLTRTRMRQSDCPAAKWLCFPSGGPCNHPLSSLIADGSTTQITNTVVLTVSTATVTR